jgi:hypothetical protein
MTHLLTARMGQPERHKKTLKNMERTTDCAQAYSGFVRDEYQPQKLGLEVIRSPAVRTNKGTDPELGMGSIPPPNLALEIETFLEPAFKSLGLPQYSVNRVLIHTITSIKTNAPALMWLCVVWYLPMWQPAESGAAAQLASLETRSRNTHTNQSNLSAE